MILGPSPSGRHTILSDHSPKITKCFKPFIFIIILITVRTLNGHATPTNTLSSNSSNNIATVTESTVTTIKSSSCLLSYSADDYSAFRIFAGIVTPIIFGLFLIVGFVGNLLVILVILLNAQMRNTTNILIFSLAVADMSFIVICVPHGAIIYVTGKWPMGQLLCRLYYYFSYVSVYCSVYTLVLMSLDRFLAVVCPIQSVHIRTQRNTTIAVIITWTVVLLTNIPLFLDAMVVSGPAEGGDSPCVTEYCTYSWLVTLNDETGIAKDNLSAGQMFFLLFFLFGYLFPFIVICLLYIGLILRLRCGRSSKMARSAEAQRSKKRVTHMVVTVVIIFGISWLPIHIIFLIQYFGKDPETGLFRIIQILCTCLAYGNSSVNPILYAFLSENFRKAFLRIIGGRKRELRVQTQKRMSFDNPPARPS